MHKFNTYLFTEEEIKARIEDILLTDEKANQRDNLLKILGCIDYTTLEGSDNDERIISLCRKAKDIRQFGPDLPNVAAVCFYPPFIRLAKKELAGTGIQIASVAGAFPSGQLPLHLKIEEVKYAVEQGADEIDMVISRGKFLAKEYENVFDEIAANKEACRSAHLKVILETGELQNIPNIRKASEIAINAGADFIKTSTGKIQPAATLEAFLIMADTVKEYYLKTGKKIGLKPAGGISTPEVAVKYYKILLKTLGDQWTDNKYFRIGASRLTDQLIQEILDLG
jgi:deoxyribose-phosphate aldolase